MKEIEREIARVDKILEGNFADKADKLYWMQKNAILRSRKPPTQIICSIIRKIASGIGEQYG